MQKPFHKPNNIHFSSGPTAKYPGWDPSRLIQSLVSRSHRSVQGAARLKEVIYRTRKILEIPDTHRIAIMPASTTGAFEALMWSLLGAKGVDVLDWDVFSRLWATDIKDQLRLKDVRHDAADFGSIPDLTKVDPDRDLVFCWNGTTTGVAVPNGDWISSERTGLTLCDATSAAFGMRLPWEKLDATAFSWQKCLGGEAQHGLVVLSPQAVERLCSYKPAWPIPRLFQMTNSQGLNEDLFLGAMINTPSMMVVEDALFALKWCEEIGGLPALIRRTNLNASILDAWVNVTSWIEHLPQDPTTRSTTSVCLKIVHPSFVALPEDQQWDFLKRMCGLIEAEGAGLDVRNHIKSKPSLRIWCGPTVEAGDLRALVPWLEYAFMEMLRLSS